MRFLRTLGNSEINIDRSSVLDRLQKFYIDKGLHPDRAAAVVQKYVPELCVASTDDQRSNLQLLHIYCRISPYDDFIGRLLLMEEHGLQVCYEPKSVVLGFITYY